MYFDKHKANIAFNIAYLLIYNCNRKSVRPVAIVLGASVYYEMKRINSTYLDRPFGFSEGGETLFGVPIKLTNDEYIISLELEEFTYDLEKEFKGDKKWRN